MMQGHVTDETANAMRPDDSDLQTLFTTFILFPPDRHASLSARNAT
jgi:hypothetical protein